MIFGCLRANGSYAIVDDTKCMLFDRTGRLESDKLYPTDVVQNKKPIKVISILSSGGYVEVCLFDGNDIVRRDGSLDTAMQLTSKKGYFRRIQTNGTHEGVRYNQMVFVYNDDVDIGGLI